MKYSSIRNIAIVAHVDHGKTTLVDGMLKQTHTFRDNQAEMEQTTILDRNALEREKGITILAKNTAVIYKKVKINVIDTPGHADFSGEIERIINMADGVVLVVDAAEGPLPQTQFVLEKALERDLKIILVINKIDRKDARIAEVLKETEELFLRLAKHEGHLSFPVLYAAGRSGKAWKSVPDNVNEPADLKPLFEEILNSIPKPDTNPDAPFKMMVSTLDHDSYKGTYAIGKVSEGSVKKGDRVDIYEFDQKKGSFSIEHIYESIGLERIEVEKSFPGDIIALTGLSDIAIGQTVVDPAVDKGYPVIKLTEPTLKIQISPNTSPLSGKEGRFFTSRQLEERLFREKKTNIGLKIDKNASGGFVISGRGELHLAVLIENLRRDGYEMQVGKPEVIITNENNVAREPFEEVTVEIDNKFIGAIIEELGKRKAEMLDTFTGNNDITRMTYRISSRNLLGFRSNMMTFSRGNGIFTSRFIGYFLQKSPVPKMRNGVLVSLENGVASAYALTTVQERGTAFISPGEQVYQGMIVGLNRRKEDMDINVCKTKKLTNIHSATADIAIHLEAATVMSLEQSLDFIEEDELMEVTPKSLRLRKKFLSPVDRIRAKRNGAI